MPRLRCALVALLTLPATIHAQGEALALQEQFKKVIEAAEPSIACVLVSRSENYGRYGAAPSADTPGRLGRFDSAPLVRPFRNDPNRRELEAPIRALDLSRPDHVPEVFGSGIVIDRAGLVLTCAHVVRRATKIYVRFPSGRGSYADILAADPRSDLAVLTLLDPPPGLKPLPFGDTDKLKKGSWVVSLSNPWAAGFRDGSPSAGVGIVSNFRRRGPSLASETEAARQPLHSFGTLLQTDMRINLGSSGGAILNLNGEVVGLTTALAALGGEPSAGFAVPLDAPMKRIIEVLRRGEEVEYGFLGITMRERDPQPGTPVIIDDVVPNGPAQLAGIARGDYVKMIEGRPVRDYDDLLLQIGIGLAGNEIKIEVASGSPTGPRRTVTARLVKSPVQGEVLAANRPPARAGLRVDYSSIVARELREIPVGVAIREVMPSSPADRARLQAGKIIRRVNGRDVATPADFYRAMDNAGARVELTVLDLSGQQEEKITLENK